MTQQQFGKQLAMRWGWLRHGIVWRMKRLYRRARHPLSNASEAPLRSRHLYSVAFGPNGRRLMSRLRQELLASNVGYLEGGAKRPTARRLHIAADDIEAFCACALANQRDIRVIARVRGHSTQDLTSDLCARLGEAGRAFDLLVVERDVPGDVPHLQCSRIEVCIWNRYQGFRESDYFESHSDIPLVGRLRSDTFIEMTARGHDLDDVAPSAGGTAFAVDAVYTWVDGDDPVWQLARAEHMTGPSRKPTRSATTDERFRNRDELKYSLRSLEQFAPWIRKIFIVTAGQRPEWLASEHPKITLVDHRDIYANLDDLPTFNSSGIETQLHRIPGLANRFLYFNDDFFLGQLCDPEDFFHTNGIIKYFEGTQRAYEADIDRHSAEYIQADKNAIELMAGDFPALGRSIMNHVPYPCDRDLLFELEARYPDAFAECAGSRFRSKEDIRPIAFMQYHYGYQTQRALPGSISHRYLALWKLNIDEQLENVASKRKYKTFCINDYDLQPERTTQVNEAVVEFLNEYYPLPSSFEDDRESSHQSGEGGTLT